MTRSTLILGALLVVLVLVLLVAVFGQEPEGRMVRIRDADGLHAACMTWRWQLVCLPEVYEPNPNYREGVQ